MARMIKNLKEDKEYCWDEELKLPYLYDIIFYSNGKSIENKVYYELTSDFGEPYESKKYSDFIRLINSL